MNAQARFAVAPMIDWTDRHCRFFHRLIAPEALLYTEMVTTGALLHGDAERHLRFSAEEHPVALQLGGSEPEELARAARLGAEQGYDEINLNCGCPSERVQKGAFGACLMREPELVADCVRAMREAVRVPVTVKHRIGVDEDPEWEGVRRFVEVVAAAGCATFIVHARKAWLKGLSPKENRQVPPLRYELVHRLAEERPDLRFVLNGGLRDPMAAAREAEGLAGIMVGREAYENPFALKDFARAMGQGASALDRHGVLLQMAAYASREAEQNRVPLRAIARHLLGLFNGLKGARAFRRTVSEGLTARTAGPELLLRAAALVQRIDEETRAA